jgi:hypothetical protein
LKTITQSDTSDEAVRRLEKSMERLQRLELSKGYVELLKEAEELRYAFTNVETGPWTLMDWIQQGSLDKHLL